MRRDRRKCQIQGADCEGVAQEIDHIVPDFEGGTDELSNLRAVCRRCHAEKTQAEARRARARLGRRRPPASRPGSIAGAAPGGPPPPGPACTGDIGPPAVYGF
ncbi:HNH endonuclease [Corynebacterium wankanglinii]